MSTFEIVEGLNKCFESVYPNKGYFISRLKIDSNALSKVYKTYTIELWFNSKEKKELILSKSITSRVVTDNDRNTILRDINISLSELIFKNYNKIMNYGI
jgi:hypothetical protein